jgi:light-independent protochlorophyllide reductase subunit B
MGLEEHLLTMFRGDFEFHDAAPASHLGRSSPSAASAMPQPAEQPLAAEPMPLVPDSAPAALAMPAAIEPITVPDLAGTVAPVAEATATWADEARAELQKIPFFVRGKARRNTERFALERGVALITVETLYDAKSHFGR